MSDKEKRAEHSDGQNSPSADKVVHPLPSDHVGGTDGPANAPFAPADITPPADDNESTGD